MLDSNFLAEKKELHLHNNNDGNGNVARGRFEARSCKRIRIYGRWRSDIGDD